MNETASSLVSRLVSTRQQGLNASSTLQEFTDASAAIRAPDDKAPLNMHLPEIGYLIQGQGEFSVWQRNVVPDAGDYTADPCTEGTQITTGSWELDRTTNKLHMQTKCLQVQDTQGNALPLEDCSDVLQNGFFSHGVNSVGGKCPEGQIMTAVGKKRPPTSDDPSKTTIYELFDAVACCRLPCDAP